jgi:hypothetical protein
MMLSKPAHFECNEALYSLSDLVQKGYQVTKWMKGHATSLYNHQDAILQA